MTIYSRCALIESQSFLTTAFQGRRLSLRLATSATSAGIVPALCISRTDAIGVRLELSALIQLGRKGVDGDLAYSEK